MKTQKICNDCVKVKHDGPASATLYITNLGFINQFAFENMLKGKKM